MSLAATVAIPTPSIASSINILGQKIERPRTPHEVPTIFIVDDDVSTRLWLEDLARSEGWQPQICDSAQEFLALPRRFVPNCLILAFSSEQSSCLEVQKRIARECSETSIIIIAEYADIPTTVLAMKAGATDFILKPCSAGLLVTAIRQSLARSRAALDRETEMRELRNCYASLTPREQQVMTLVASGLPNKHVAAELGISEITVKAHRGQMMQKMKAPSFAHLVNMALKLRITKRAASYVA